jgi:transcription factor-like protein
MIDLENQDTAEAYYVAAQKRLGLLGNAIQDIQCFFFATIFEKFSLRPLRAWFHVQQACNRLESRLLQRGERPLTPFNEPWPDNHHLEQRLYWSCFRAER